MNYFMVDARILDKFRDGMCVHGDWSMAQKDYRVCRCCGRIEVLVAGKWVRTDDIYQFREFQN